MFRFRYHISSLLLVIFVFAVGCRISSVLSCSCHDHSQMHICCSCDAHDDDCATHTHQLKNNCLVQDFSIIETLYIQKEGSLRSVDISELNLLTLLSATFNNLELLANCELLMHENISPTSQPHLKIYSRRAPPRLV